MSFSKIIKDVLKYIVIWIIAWIIFFFIKYFGTEELPAFERVLPARPLNIFLSAIFLGFSIGLPFGIIDKILDSQNFRKRSYLFLIVVKGISQFVFTLISFTLLLFIIIRITDFHQYTDIDDLYPNLIISKTSALILGYSILVTTLIHAFQLMLRKIGGDMMINLLKGKYHSPREEKRIFMFLDLKSSTTHAEKLGHIRFSNLIQDCFNDLTPAILKHNVEVYQYVGDEAVLTWKVDDGLKDNNCINIYFTFQHTLENKEDYYNRKYGIAPFFKAGVHIGLVTVAEVGVIKREIAYHSDVLNTAARIQSKCNEFNTPLLVSEDLFQLIKNANDYEHKSIGGMILKGKEQAVNIYSISEIQDKIKQ